MKSVHLNFCHCLGENIEIINLSFIDKTWISRHNFCFSIQSNIVLNFTASVGGIGVPQQRPWDVLGGLLRLPPGWSNTSPYWSSTVSQGKTFFNWVTSLLSPLCIEFSFCFYCRRFPFFCVFRMQVSVRWGSCWAAVVSVSLWPVRSVWRAYPRHPLARSCSTKVRKPSLKSLKL